MEHSVVVMPAYNAGKTVATAFHNFGRDLLANVILADDGCSDNTIDVASALSNHVFRHSSNRGQGGCQATRYDEAPAFCADSVVMVYPNYQYDARV